MAHNRPCKVLDKLFRVTNAFTIGVEQSTRTSQYMEEHIRITHADINHSDYKISQYDASEIVLATITLATFEGLKDIFVGVERQVIRIKFENYVFQLSFDHMLFCRGCSVGDHLCGRKGDAWGLVLNFLLIINQSRLHGSNHHDERRREKYDVARVVYFTILVVVSL